ncbi:MAG: 3-hydroxyacyl-CoA dehydrogenase family protein [Planctomycetes bacterium]|nr:3-hydroxyacyl-CoA dehydrogenase family protein [Planctomycetota bacterium]
MDNKKVGVLGSGVMGTGVAQNLAQTGHDVVLIDVSDDILNHSKEEIKKNLRFQGFFGKKEKPVDSGAILDRIIFTGDYGLLKDVFFVIENVTEKWHIKEKVYKEIDGICTDDCVFSSNTSAISITRIGSLVKNPERVLGIHFMNPVPQKTIVEMIRAHHTSDKTIEIANDLLSKMGKKSILVNDAPGFVSNRVLMLTINEAIFLVQDQVASAKDVDQIFKSCFSHKMGPLETADLIGLDTILYSIEVLYESFNDSKYRPCPLLKKMVDAGLYGLKNGEGFYRYKK